jgi:aminoglycoside phosphotransferase
MFRNKGWPDGCSPKTEDLPEDPALPQLRSLMQPERALRLLAPWLVAEGVDEERCVLRYLRYRPGRDCAVVYELPDWNRRGAWSPLLSVKAFAEAPSRERLERWERRARKTGVVGPVFGWLAEERVLITPFPVDLRLPGLPGLLAGKDLEGALTIGESPPVVASYKPGRSCLVSFDAGSPSRRLFARIHRDDRGAQVFAAMSRFHQSEDLAGRVAEPLAYIPERRLLVQGALAGKPLTEQLGDKRRSEWIESAARALAAVHGSPAHGECERSAEAELSSLESSGRSMLATLPEVFAVFESVVARLADARCPEVAATPIHGDFSAGQVLVDDARAGLIDFERVAVGDPLLDLGSFLARLPGQCEDAGLGAEAAEEAAAVFLSAYEDARGEAPNLQAVDWHRRVALLRSAINAVRHLRPGWRRRAGGLAEAARTE